MEPAAATDAVSRRSREVAQRLRESLTPIVQEVAGVGLRPAVLSRGLAIDRTLAARVLRAVRAADHVTFLHEIPAPGGLRIFLDAARTRVGDAPCDSAESAVLLFERLIDEFPGGRSALDAALSTMDDRVHQRNVRAAAQAIHKSMSSLLGYQADVMLTTIIMQPSSDGCSADQIYLLGKYGVRRLRASSPITVFGRRGVFSKEEAAAAHESVQTLDGQVAPENGNAYLLPEYCSKPLPPLSLFRTEAAYLYTLAESVPPVNTPVSLVAGLMVRNGAKRYRDENTLHAWESQIPRMPCRVLVNDVFVHDDLFYPGATPTVTATLHSIAPGPRRPDAPAFRLDNVDVRPTLVPLGRGIDGSAAREVARYPELLRTTFEKAGWDPSKFRGFRCRVQYPVPLVSVTLWFDLPSAPASSVAGGVRGGAGREEQPS